MSPMTVSQPPDPAPLVTRHALEAFSKRLVAQFSPRQVLLFGSMARGRRAGIPTLTYWW